MSSRSLDLVRIDPVVGAGAVYRARWFSDADGDTPADPTTVTFRVQLPSDGSDDEDYIYLTDSEVTKASTGVYEFRYASSEAGLVNFQAIATGTVADTIEWSVRFRSSAFDATPGAGS